MKLNNKGFTLIELIATVVILGIVASIGAYSITAIINNSKQKNYELLVENIKTASENFYMDCKHITGPQSSSSNECYFDSSDALNIRLSVLVNNGFLTSNKTKEQNGTLYNPKTNDDISNCTIKIMKSSISVIVTSTSSDSKCPTY